MFHQEKFSVCVLVRSHQVLSPYMQTSPQTLKIRNFCRKKARNEVTGWLTSTTYTTWAEIQIAHRNPKTEHKRKNILFSFLLHNILMPRKTTEFSSGNSRLKLGLRLKSFNFHEVEYNQVSSFPEYIKQDKSNLVFKAAENSFDSSS